MPKIGRNEPCPCGSRTKYKKCCLLRDATEAIKRLGLKKTVEAIDPRIFISEPYLPCPECRRVGFGVLNIYGRHYSRRCCECRYTDHFELPPVKKKIIYLDQFVISKMMKALDPKHASHERIMREDPYWLDLYKKLDRLLKLQLIVCPDSCNHRDESMVTPDFVALKRLYEHFSCGATFYDYETIVRFQVHRHLESYLAGTPEVAPPLKPTSVILGEFDKWMDHINITIDSPVKGEDVSEMRRSREAMYERLKEVFTRWQGEMKSFDELVMEEAWAYGRANWQSCVQHWQRQELVVAGKLPMDLKNILPPTASSLITDVLNTIKAAGYSDADAFVKMGEYFSSEHILQVPYIRISSMLFASIARKAKAGQRKPPNRGTFTDINAISSVLPYCGAVFVDNEYATYLHESPLRERLVYDAKVFSTNTRNNFLAYLDEIEKDADPRHLETVEGLYGKDWSEPYLGILREDDREP